MAAHHRNAERWVGASLVGLLGSFFVLAHVYSALYHHNVVDDSLISLTYVQNVVAGHGLVFNLGERVEGYTNFLWIIALVPFQGLARVIGMDLVPLAVEVSIAFATLDLLLVFLLSRRLFGDGRPALLAVAWCAADNAYAVWSMMALENHFLAFWVLLTLWVWGSSLRHRAVFLGLCLAAVQMTRPDGALFSVAFFLAHVTEWLRRAQVFPYRGGRTPAPADSPPVPMDVAWSPRQIGHVILIGGVVYGTYFAWRASYYGALLPNTFYLKVGSSEFDAWARGLAYLREFLVDRGGLPLLALPAIAWAAHPVVRTLWLWTALHAVYVCLIGGDFYPGQRFLVVLVPALALLGTRTVWGLAERAFRERPRLRTAVTVVVSAGVVLVTAGLGVQRGPLQTEILRFGEGVAAQVRSMQWLGEHSAPGESIVVGDIGSAGYYTDLHIHDVYGVIDPVIAHRDVPLGAGLPGHEKFGDLRYFLDKSPTYVKPGYVTLDFSRHGYFLNTAMPLGEGVIGVWERDTLPERARIVPGTTVDFGQRDERFARSGDAFAEWPSHGPPPGQNPITGHRGAFVSSFHPVLRDSATGALTSPPFAIQGDLVEVLVAGGHDPERLTVSLVIAGQRVKWATGFNTETFGRALWDVRAYRNQTAVLQVVDEATGDWGHIMIDELRQWQLIE